MPKIFLTGNPPGQKLSIPDPVPNILASRQNSSFWFIRKWLILMFTSLGILYTSLVGVYLCWESFTEDQIYICCILAIQALTCIICQMYGFQGAFTGSRLCAGIYWIYTIIDAGQQALATGFCLLYPIQHEFLMTSGCTPENSDCGRVLLEQDSIAQERMILPWILLGQTVVSSLWALVAGTLFYDLSQVAKMTIVPGTAQIV